MKKIYMFDVTGKYIKTFDSIIEAKELCLDKLRREQYKEGIEKPYIVAKHRIYIARNLFREVSTAHGYIFTFEDDERIRKTEDGIIWLDCVDENTTKMEDYITGIVNYKPVDKKYDAMECPNRVIVCYKNNQIGDEEIIIVKTVAEAKKRTGAKFVWGSLLGENKTSNGWSFKYAKI